MKVSNNGSQFTFQLSGPIGETSPLFIYKIRDATEVVVDLKEVTFINSIGVKSWVMWAMKIPLRCPVSFFNCPYVIINQFNMVVGFMPANGKVKSFFAPYHCEHCNFEKFELFTDGIEYFNNPDPGQVAISYPAEKPCPKCGKAMEADFFKEKLFKFLQKN